MFFSNKIHKCILFLFVILALTIEIPIITAGFQTKPVASDTIIILGAKLIGPTPSTILRLRLDEGIKLYKLGYAATIIVSGGQGKDEEISEAAGMQQYLVQHGIDPTHILLEDQSASTYQNLKYSKDIMQANGLNTAIIVSNSSHIRRALVLAQHVGIEASGSPAPMSNNIFLTTGQYLREGIAMVTVLYAGK